MNDHEENLPRVDHPEYAALHRTAGSNAINPASRDSYDEYQVSAPLRACVACGRSFYMTHPKERCSECREKSGLVEWAGYPLTWGDEG